MHRTRTLGLLPLALVALGSTFAGAYAQTDGVAKLDSGKFDGPAPLAWRWQGFSRTLSGGSPLVQGDRILVALGNRMYALDRSSGNQIWRFPLSEPIEGNFRSSPQLVDGVLVAAADNRNIYGVDPDTGTLKWIYQAPFAIVGNPVVTANGKSIAFMMQGDQLQIVAAATGEAGYSAPVLIKDRVAGQIAGYGDSIIYFSQNGRLNSIAANSQKVNWSKAFAVLPPLPQPIVVGETLYSYSGQYLVALSASAGTTRYQARLNEQPFSAPIVGAAGSLVLTSAGKAYYYDNSGNLKTPKPIDIGSQPIVPGTAVGDLFVVPTVNGAVNLVNPAKQTVDWSFVVRPSTPDAAVPAEQSAPPRGPGGITRTDTGPSANLTIQASSPVVLAGTTLLVPARDGSLLAFDKEFGVDLTPPDVKLAWPTPGEDVSGQPPLELIFKIDDEASGLKLDTLTLEIDGTAWESTFTKEGYLLGRVTSGGKNKPLPNGRHTIVVTARDWMGNETKKTFTLNVDNTLKPLVRPSATTNPNNPGGGPGGGFPGGPGGRGPGGFGGGPGGR